MNALQRIEAAGFPFMKVEFEGQLNRLGHRLFSREDNCEEFILQNISAAARKATVFTHFYNDHSVDSEITVTLPTSKARYFLEYAQAFKALADANGRGLDVAGAGMHMATMLRSSYPYLEQMPARNYNNFERQVTKLLPALYWLGSPSQRSRGLFFREPQISASRKYSAIYSRRRTLFEFRLFETCYNRPQALLDNFEVIANCLEFYAHPYKQLDLGLSLRFGFSDRSRTLERFYLSPDKMRVLEAGLAQIKPANKTLAVLRKERRFYLTVAKAQKHVADQQAGYSKNYEEALQRWDWAAKKALDTYEPMVQIKQAGQWQTEARSAEALLAHLLEHRLVPTKPQLNDFVQTEREDYQLNI